MYTALIVSIYEGIQVTIYVLSLCIYPASLLLIPEHPHIQRRSNSPQFNDSMHTVTNFTHLFLRHVILTHNQVI